MKKTLSLRKISRKQWLLIAIIGVVLLLAAGVAWQEYAWRSYVDRNNKLNQQVSSSASEQLGGVKDSESLESMSLWLSRVSANMCDAPNLTGVRASVSGDTQRYQDDCKRYQMKIQTAVLASDNLKRHLQSGQDIADVIDDAVKRLETIDATKYGEREKIWRDAQSSLQALRVADSIKQLKISQAEAVGAIVVSYQNLAKADKAKSRSQFDAAIEKITRAYEMLKGTSGEAQDTYEPIAQHLIDSIKAL